MMDERQIAELGISINGGAEDREKLLEAYNKAHHIREFEIQLYWTRSSYLWTLQAAALAALALLFSTTDISISPCSASEPKTGMACQSARLRLLLLFSLWSFGTFSAYVWLLILRGGKFWQDNWERYVDLLEGHVSGHLYKTYRVRNKTRPYSVSKLNEAMALFTLTLWIFIGIGASLILIEPQSFAVVAIPILLILCAIVWFSDCCLRMKSLGKEVSKAVHEDGKPEYLYSRNKHR